MSKTAETEANQKAQLSTDDVAGDDRIALCVAQSMARLHGRQLDVTNVRELKVWLVDLIATRRLSGYLKPEPSDIMMHYCSETVGNAILGENVLHRMPRLLARILLTRPDVITAARKRSRGASDVYAFVWHWFFKNGIEEHGVSGYLTSEALACLDGGEQAWKILGLVWSGREDLQRHFDISKGRDRANLRAWFNKRVGTEYAAAAPLLTAQPAERLG